MAERPGLVIFDCDGVLVDSEPLAAQVNVELLHELGWPISVAEVQERFIGGSNAYFRATIEAHLGRPVPHDWDARFRQRFELVAEAQLSATAGVAAVVAALVASEVPICVASNSRRDRVTWCLARTGLLRSFEGRIFSAWEVAQPKPAPDVFLLAAASMGVDPPDAVVVEDSRFGVEAARRAGMAVYGYAGGLTRPEVLSGPGTTVFSNMADLLDLLGLVADPALRTP